MVFPVGDFLRRRTTPYVNWMLIAVNVAVFLYTISLSHTTSDFLGPFRISPADKFYYQWGALPGCIADYVGVHTNAPPQQLTAVCPSGSKPLLTIFTAMFMHASWGHIFGNMLFLWIFGDNVEDRLGHIPYLGFYLVCGIIAFVVQTAFSVDSLTPTVGASGAIAGVLGAYLLLYPGAIVQVIVLPFFFLPFFVPAVLLIGIWFLMQLVGGLSQIGQTVGSGIAFWAHVGGFAAGLVLVWIFGVRSRGTPGLRQL